MPMATPPPGSREHLEFDGLAVRRSNQVMVSLPLPGTLEVGGAVLVAEGMTTDDDRLRQPGTSRGTFCMMIGSRKITPPRMLRIVPFGERHIFLRPNSSTAGFVGRDGRALHADAVPS